MSNNSRDNDQHRQAAGDQPNAETRVEITAADLPLHCPMPGKRLWDSHPKVFLPIADSGAQTCPYCGTVYVLRGAAESAH